MTQENASDGSQMHKADFITSLLLLAFSLAVVLLSLDLPRLEHRDINPWTIPGIVPAVLGVIIGLMSLALLIRSIRSSGHRLGLSGAVIRNMLGKPETKRVTVTIAISLVYSILLVGWLHYAVGTLLFMLIFIVLFEYSWEVSLRPQLKRLGTALLEAVIVAVAVSALFQYVFLVRLP